MHITAHIVVPDAAEAGGWYANAFGARELAEVRATLTDAFWGERHGQLTDPFGHRWNIAQRLRDVPQEEIVAAAGRASGSA